MDNIQIFDNQDLNCLFFSLLDIASNEELTKNRKRASMVSLIIAYTKTRRIQLMSEGYSSKQIKNIIKDEFDMLKTESDIIRGVFNGS